MGCRKERADAARVRATKEHGPFELRRVDDDSKILHQCLQRRRVGRRKAIREPHSAPVDEHHPSERREPVQKPGEERVAPGDLEIVDPLRRVDELDRSISKDLVCECHIPIAHVMDVRNFHNRKPAPSVDMRQ